MKIIYKIVVTIAFLLLTAGILTVNYNQVYADTAGIDGHGGVIVCPDSNVSFDVLFFGLTVDPRGQVSISASESGQVFGGIHVRDGGNVPDFNVQGAGIKQLFVYKGTMFVDNVCNSDVPSDVTIRGSCSVDGIVTLIAKNGLQAESIVFTNPHDPQRPFCTQN